PTTRYSGCWSHSEVNGLVLVARSDDPAPADVPDARFQWIGFDQIAAADGGKTFFTAAAYSPAGWFDGIWSSGPSRLRLIARSGMSAPGLDPSYRFTSLTYTRRTRISRDGQVSLLANTERNYLDTRQGLWADRGNGLELIAKDGDTVPGPSAPLRLTLTNLQL